MQTIFLTLIFFKLFASILSAYYAFRIAKFYTTETRGWMIAALAFSALAIRNILALRFIDEIVKSLVFYHNSFVVSYQTFEGLAAFLLLVTLARSYYRLKRINTIT